MDKNQSCRKKWLFKHNSLLILDKKIIGDVKNHRFVFPSFERNVIIN